MTHPGDFVLLNFPTTPKGKFKTLLHPFYNPHGWPGILALGKSDDKCIKLFTDITEIDFQMVIGTTHMLTTQSHDNQKDMPLKKINIEFVYPV